MSKSPTDTLVSPTRSRATFEAANRPGLSNRTTNLSLSSLKAHGDHDREQDKSLAEWRNFLTKYAAGEFSPSEQPPIPPLSSPSTRSNSHSSRGKQLGESPLCMSNTSEDASIKPVDALSNTEEEHAEQDPEPVTEQEFPAGDLDPHMGTDFNCPVYDSIEIGEHTARRVREFYKRHAYLPPPRAPLELLREQIIKEYDLYSSEQVQNIQAALDLVRAYFGGICTFSLFQQNVQVLMACSGPPEVLDAVGLFRGKRLLPETSLCGHSVLFANGSTHIYIPDLAQDWRYQGNPYADEMKGVRTYIGATVSLRIDPASRSNETVAVGVINSMHLDGVLPPLSADQSRVMTSVARFLTEILQATWEGLHRTREARARRVVSDFLDHIMLPKPSNSAAPSPTQRLRWHLGKHGDGLSHDRRESQDTISSIAGTPYSTSRHNEEDQEDVVTAAKRSVLSPSESIVSTDITDEPDNETKVDPLERDAGLVVTEVRRVLAEADGAAVVDLRSLHAIKDTKGVVKYVMDPESVHSLNTIAWSGLASTTERPDFLSAGARMAFMKSLYMQQYDAEVAFEPQNNRTSGLEPHLPTSTCSHLVIPFMAGIQPLFSIIITSSEKYWTFRKSDINFVRSMGVILRAQVLQSRVLEADMAKTTFLSSISHELRTPLHGLMSGLQLFEDAIDNEDLSQAAEFLPIIKNSGYALQNILNDMLEFGQLAHGKAGTTAKKVDLGQMVVSAVKTCIPRYYTWHKGTSHTVTITVEYEDRDWTAKIDESGFQRTLYNGITNAMKVTESGNITVSLRSSTSSSGVSLKIIDTGPGIDPKFASKLFQPFSKANSFKPGAGLGLYITKALVERMSGNISLYSTPGVEGATFEVNIPLDLATPVAGGNGEVEMIRESIDMVEAEKYKGRSQSSKPKAAVAIPNGAPSPSGTPTQTPVQPLHPPGNTGVQAPAPLRVLVVDDNEISRKILLALLRKMSKTMAVETAQAADGLEAIDVFKPFHPHLVLTDVSMPRADGITASTEMRKIEREEGRPRCQIFAITGLGSSDPRLKAAALRDDILDGWIVKGKDGLTGIKQIVLNASSRWLSTSGAQAASARLSPVPIPLVGTADYPSPFGGSPRPITNGDSGRDTRTPSIGKSLG